MKLILTNVQSVVKGIQPILLISLAFAILSLASCKDDEISCDAVQSQLEQVWRDLQEAAFEGKCNDVNTLFNKSFSLLRKGKNCAYVQELINDEGFTDVESYIDYLEEERDRVLDALSC